MCYFIPEPQSQGWSQRRPSIATETNTENLDPDEQKIISNKSKVLLLLMVGLFLEAYLFEGLKGVFPPK